jgi:hypothetical protein
MSPGVLFDPQTFFLKSGGNALMGYQLLTGNFQSGWRATRRRKTVVPPADRSIGSTGQTVSR